MVDVEINDVKRWELKIGAGEIGVNTCIGEDGNLVSLEDGHFLMNEEDAIKEGHRRYKGIHFYLCGPMKAITWDAE